MFGAFRLNTLSAAAAGGSLGARASAATTLSSAGPTYTTTNKFGSHSLDNTNTSYRETRITVFPADTTWFLTSNKIWTVEFWYSAATLGSESARRIFSLNSSLGDTRLNLVDPISNGTWQLDYYNSGTRISDAHMSNGLPEQGQWYHFAWVSNGSGNIAFYSNGALRNSSSQSITGTHVTNNRSISIGHDSTFGNSANSRLLFDEVRISNIRRYTAAFTPSAAAFTNDANTLALFHFNNSATDDIA